MHAALFDRGRLRILILVDHVLVGALGHELLHLRLNPGSAKGRKILLRIAVEHKLIVDGLIDRLRILRRLGKLVRLSAGVVGFRFDCAGGGGGKLFGVVQGHGGNLLCLRFAV